MGPRTRAQIAAETGLNKATVSSLVAELVQRGLVREGTVLREGSIGRPGQVVELDGHGVCGVGLEVNVDYVAAIVLNLRGDVISESSMGLDVPRLGPDGALDALADVAREAIRAAADSGATPVGVTVAIPGLVDVAQGVLTFAPNLRWRDVPVVEALLERLERPTYPVRVDNDANLSALAEYLMGGSPDVSNLVYLTGEVGVGGGVIVDGRLLRGVEGFSGEVGHMPFGSAQHVCGCGRRGCWETAVGLAALLRAVADPDDPVREPVRGLEPRLAEIKRRAEGGDERTLAALQQIGAALGLGASVLVNLFNPRAVVLGGYFATLGQYFLEPAMAELRARVLAPDAAGCRLELSTLGFTAAVRGGAHVALEAVLADPTLVPATDRRSLSSTSGLG
ncbi:ROK family protein [Micromonospora sp. MP36]|nr:ROK family protein [Micromonospora sp. MP36]